MLWENHQPEARKVFHRFTQQAKHLKHPKREGASPENFAGPQLFRVTKKTHVTWFQHGKASHPSGHRMAGSF